MKTKKLHSKRRHHVSFEEAITRHAETARRHPRHSHPHEAVRPTMVGEGLKIIRFTDVGGSAA